MGLSIADIDTWNPESISAVGAAAAARAAAAQQASSGLQGLSAFDSWQGEAANAAQARTQTHAANLDHHGQSASAVATAANTAANEVRQVKSQLSELRSTLGQYGMTVDANSSRVLPPTNMSSLSTANRKLVQEAAKTGQQSLDKLRQAADQADDLLASAMTASNGNELRGIDGGKVGQDDGPHRPYPGQTLPVSNHDDFDLDTQFNRAVGDTKSPMPVGSARSWAQCDGNWCAG